ncbi:MAG: 3-carboxy-cis,cis-muconate cycloisomerase [Paracoccaceae bacterium]|jgi:3-carboxy-cis,cis-muconate cycloisomerase
MAQQSIGEIKLSASDDPSTMALKSNPVLAKILVTRARFVALHQRVLLQFLVHGQERSGAAWML